jgi:hypothetical protein
MNHRTLTTKRRPPAKETPGDVTQVLASAASPASASIDEDTRRQLIAVEAYFLAERRGLAPGCELDDWLAAEAIVEGRFRGASTSGQAHTAGRARLV